MASTWAALITEAVVIFAATGAGTAWFRAKMKNSVAVAETAAE